MPDESKVIEFVKYIIQKAISGIGPLSSAEQLANEYLDDKSYRTNDQRVDSLINWEISKNSLQASLLDLVV